VTEPVSDHQSDTTASLSSCTLKNDVGLLSYFTSLLFNRTMAKPRVSTQQTHKSMDGANVSAQKCVISYEIRLPVEFDY
jgi:hypothetical protein